MPTGYTAKLMEEGETFEQFAIRCARAFGALILMRDEPMDAPITEEFKPSDYYVKAGADARAELDRLEAMGGNERIAFGEALRAQSAQRSREWLEKDRAANGRLTTMRTEVEAWEPPSPDHANYKAFMLEQIDMSLNDLGYIEKTITEAEQRAAVDYYAQAVKTAERNIGYYAAEHAKEVERTESRNQWIRQLRDSLRATEQHA